jgi:acylphosphatase
VKRVRVLISGRVQGVWFRASAEEVARELGLAGFVRNLPDGRVEAAFEGNDADVDRAVAWCWEGPPHAHVDEVEMIREDPSGESGFRVS